MASSGPTAMRTFLAASLLALACVAHGQVLRMHGAPSTTPKAAVVAAWRGAGTSAAHEVRLPPALEHLSLDDVVAGEKALAVGMRRDVPPAQGRLSNLAWSPATGGGFAVRLRVASPGALALRVLLRFDATAGPREVRVASAVGAAPIQRANRDQWASAMARDGGWWTPLTDGESQDIELWSDAPVAPRGAVEVVAVSHTDASPAAGFKAGGVGAAQGCHEDVACVAAINPAVAQAARAVMKIAYVRNGMGYVCTGTLLNDGASREVPYIYTAAHCIDSQAVAATVNTFWYFEAAQCGVATPGQYQQLSGGATLLYADTASDVALLRLADRAPAGAWFAGWDASPATAGLSVVALHHPMGDLKKLSIGDVMPDADARSLTTGWRVGATEPGSSGSGLFTVSGNEYLLRGGLKGGSASCSTSGNLGDPSNRDEYSRIDLALPALLPWLGGAVAPIEDFGGLWYDADEPGWGVSVVQSPQGKAFVTWYTYDAEGAPRWFVAPDVAWTSTAALSATLYRGRGSAYDRTYEPSRFALQPAGALQLTFGRGTAVARITLDGRTIEKALVRMQF